ncbi:hypothetical protein N7486_004808 [Penicillium sp. IBT 16267x]|nr:hypothetical protein N7486_004808 [Penicillium sp. IBT 16267x]
MDLYYSPEEANSPHCTDMYFLPENTYSSGSSDVPLLPAENYLAESMDLCLLPANAFSPEGMIMCEFSEQPHSTRNTDVFFLAAETYVPDNLDLCLLSAKTYEPESADLCVLPAKTYEPESEDMFLLPAETYSPNSTSDYGRHSTPPAEDPNAHSSMWFRPAGPEEAAEYRNLAKCNPHLVDFDIEMADAMQEFMPISLPSSAGTSDKSPDSDESSIRALLSPESCSPGFSNIALETKARQSLIPAGLNLPIKRGPENQPILVNPGAFKRPRSQAASLRSASNTQGAKRLSATRPITSRLCTRFSPSRQSRISLLSGINEINEPACISTAKDDEPPNRKKLFGSDGWLGPHPGSITESPVFEPPPMPPLKPTPKPALFRGLSKKFKKQVLTMTQRAPRIHSRII